MPTWKELEERERHLREKRKKLSRGMLVPVLISLCLIVVISILVHTFSSNNSQSVTVLVVVATASVAFFLPLIRWWKKGRDAERRYESELEELRPKER